MSTVFGLVLVSITVSLSAVGHPAAGPFWVAVAGYCAGLVAMVIDYEEAQNK